MTELSCSKEGSNLSSKILLLSPYRQELRTILGNDYNVWIAREDAYIMIETCSVHRHHENMTLQISGLPNIQGDSRDLPPKNSKYLRKYSPYHKNKKSAK